VLGTVCMNIHLIVSACLNWALIFLVKDLLITKSMKMFCSGGCVVKLEVPLG